VTIGALGGPRASGSDTGCWLKYVATCKTLAQHGRLAKMSFPQQLVGMSTTTIAIAVSLLTTTYIYVFFVATDNKIIVVNRRLSIMTANQRGLK